MNPEWFYSDGDVRKGPVTFDELRQMIEQGRLKPSDLVWKEGMADWAELRTVPELAANLPIRMADRNDDEAPRRRRRDDYVDDEDDRPRSRSRDRDRDRDRDRGRRDEGDDEFNDYDDRPRTPRGQKPSQVQTVGILLLVGGIMGLIVTLSIVLGSMFICCLWPGVYMELIWAIYAIMRGTNMMNHDDQGPPRTLLILQILCIINGDIMNCIMGIVGLVMLNDPQVAAYYRRKGWA